MAVLVGQHDRNAVAHRRHERIGRAEIDADREPCSRGAGASGSEICRSAISDDPRVRCGAIRRAAHHPSTREHGVDVGGDLRQEAELAHRHARRVPCAVDVEQRRDALLELPRLGAHLVEHSLERARIAAGHRRVGGRLAPLELPLEEIERQRGVGFVERLDAVQRQQVLRARDRILQRAVGLVDPCRRLQREPLLGVARGRVTVRMHFALQRVVGAIERAASKRKRSGRPNSSKWLREKSIIAARRRRRVSRPEAGDAAAAGAPLDARR